MLVKRFLKSILMVFDLLVLCAFLFCYISFYSKK